MYYACGIGDDEVESSVNKCLEALALKKRGRLRWNGAISIRLILCSHRSAEMLATGDKSGALEDAEEASTLASHYPHAYICEGDVFMARTDFTQLRNPTQLLRVRPSIRCSKSFNYIPLT